MDDFIMSPKVDFDCPKNKCLSELIQASEKLFKDTLDGNERKFLQDRENRAISRNNQRQIQKGVNFMGIYLNPDIEMFAIPAASDIYVDKTELIDFVNRFIGKEKLLHWGQCLNKEETFTQETTLSGHQIKKTILNAKGKGYKL